MYFFILIVRINEIIYIYLSFKSFTSDIIYNYEDIWIIIRSYHCVW